MTEYDFQFAESLVNRMPYRDHVPCAKAEEIARKLSYKKDWKFSACDNRIIIEWIVTDIQNPEKKITITSSAAFADYWNDELIYNAVFHAVLDMERHEASEFFKVNGEAIFNEHLIYPERFRSR